MDQPPLLSIVTPTRGDFSRSWLKALLQVEGNVEFVFVYPPTAHITAGEDPRLRIIRSPYQGELIQRLLGLLNASGKYLLALDDDDFVHPQISTMTETYFSRFPKSWVMRPYMEFIAHTETERIERPWDTMPAMTDLHIRTPQDLAQHPQWADAGDCLLEIPIAPLNLRLKLRHAFWPFTQRTDMHGVHFENFNNRVWSSERVKPALAALLQNLTLFGPLKLIPAWSLDRLLGLYIQAFFFRPGTTIGHWLPKPGQVRFIARPASMKEIRSTLLAESLLVRSFPSYAYFWHLFFYKLYQETPRVLIDSVWAKFWKTR